MEESTRNRRKNKEIRKGYNRSGPLDSIFYFRIGKLFRRGKRLFVVVLLTSRVPGAAVLAPFVFLEIS